MLEAVTVKQDQWTPEQGRRDPTPRELQILCMHSQGHKYNEIGAMLSISPLTVKQHAHNLQLKLDARSMPHAFLIALSLNMITLERH